MQYPLCSRLAWALSFSSRPKQSWQSMVEPPGTNRHSTQMHLRDNTSQCVPLLSSLTLSSGDTFSHDTSAETVHKIHKQRIKVVRLLRFTFHVCHLSMFNAIIIFFHTTGNRSVSRCNFSIHSQKNKIRLASETS